jgi:hypothetical protein
MMKEIRNGRCILTALSAKPGKCQHDIDAESGARGDLMLIGAEVEVAALDGALGFGNAKAAHQRRQQRGLARAIVADESGDARIEADLHRIRAETAEVCERDRFDLHGGSMEFGDECRQADDRGATASIALPRLRGARSISSQAYQRLSRLY